MVSKRKLARTSLPSVDSPEHRCKINRVAGQLKRGELLATRVDLDLILIHFEGTSVREAIAEVKWADGKMFVNFEPPKINLNLGDLAALLTRIFDTVQR